MRDDNNDSSVGGDASTSGEGVSKLGSNNVTDAAAPPVPMPKHIPFPDFVGNSELLNELVMFVFTVGVAAMQFINIYRTGWWLPESYTNYVVKLDHIEPYLATLIVIMTARRLIYCCLLRAVDMMKRSKQQRLYRNLLKYIFGGVLMLVLSFCILKIYKRHTYLSLFLLVYPLIVYLLIFGFRIEPFLRSACEVEGAYINGMPMHCCSSAPVTIRDEIELLRNDFNTRFKQVIFTAAVNAYYAGFVPCFFAVSIYYNMLWTTQHIVAICLSVFTLSIAFLFPAKYCDILHRAALHLGYWTRLDALRPTNGATTTSAAAGSSSGTLAGGSIGSTASATWNKNAAWANGSVVKYSGELFRCIGPVTVAIPGNTSHLRFYRLFHDPSIIYFILTMLQVSILFAEIIQLYFAIEWHFVLSISFIALTNQFTFFKIMRDYCVTKHIYSAETSISDKQLNAAHFD